MEALRRAPAVGQALGIESDVELPEVLLEAIGGGLKASAELGDRAGQTVWISATATGTSWHRGRR